MCDDCVGPLTMDRRRFLLAVPAVALGVRAQPIDATTPIPVTDGLVIRPRSAWDGGHGATGELVPEEVRFLLVHHTAGPNEYEPYDVPALIRDAYRFHVGPSKGWPDIAYNFLIDRFGGVWEGRTGSLTGPVMADATGGSQGFAQLVCLLGDFTDEMPTDPALDSLTRTLRWLADRFSIDTTPGATTRFVSRGSNRWPAGREVVARTISGHRDMSATACPGDTFYPVVRDELQGRVDALRSVDAPSSSPPTSDDPAPATAPPTVVSSGPPTVDTDPSDASTDGAGRATGVGTGAGAASGSGEGGGSGRSAPALLSIAAAGAVAAIGALAARRRVSAGPSGRIDPADDRPGSSRSDDEVDRSGAGEDQDGQEERPL